MKLLKLHKKNISISYRNSVCSVAFIFVFTLTLGSVIVPIILVSLLSPYSGVSERLLIFEQPYIQFQFKYIFVGQNNDGDIIACSSFSHFNQIAEKFQKCRKTKYWQRDWNRDYKMDEVNFELVINNDPTEPFELQNFYLVVFFEATLMEICTLKPPAVIVQNIDVPSRILPSGEIAIEGVLQLTQNREFVCPFFGRHLKSYFNNEFLSLNETKAESYTLKSIHKKIQENPGYFELQRQDKYFTKTESYNGIKIKLKLRVIETSVRYHLNIWRRLGQFWLYFASFFGISFYVCNKIKDYLFDQRILRSWEIIPWKKLY